MLRPAIRKTPGVYITEHDAFSTSVVGVQTAVPAFIGFTQRSEKDGQSVFKEAVEIHSMMEFEEIFGGLPEAIYKLEQLVEGELESYEFQIADPSQEGKATYWKLNETPSAGFHLYSCMQLFYANGGGRCYVVSVGHHPKDGVKLPALEEGLKVIADQDGPTMLAIPDAVSLNHDEAKAWVSTEFAKLAKAMLNQCRKRQDRVSILDVYGSPHAKKHLKEVIQQFREDVGSEALDYGMAYFPFLETSVFTRDAFTYWNVETHAGDLAKILGWENANVNNGGKVPEETKGTYKEIGALIEAMKEDKGGNRDATKSRDQNLTRALPVLGEIKSIMARKSSLLPPSAAMAGVCTLVDRERGVWNAPANVSLQLVRAPNVQINSDQQEDLNVPLNGKAIDVIREFTGRGTVVWGARTLDGNSQDWRYIQVRRTMIYVQQSIKAALDPYIFKPNVASTWSAAVSMVSSFLKDVWTQGGLMGSTAQEAFTVNCGLGTTMTAKDILDGYMIVQVKLRMVRPAEFIEVTFKQEMEGFLP